MMKHRTIALLVWAGLMVGTVSLLTGRHPEPSGPLLDNPRPPSNAIISEETFRAGTAPGMAPRTDTLREPTPGPGAAPARKRRWDPGFLASLRGAVPGSPIQFELVSGEVAAGRIRYLVHTCRFYRIREIEH